jgi:hypothetical protein
MEEQRLQIGWTEAEKRFLLRMASEWPQGYPLLRPDSHVARLTEEHRADPSMVASVFLQFCADFGIDAPPAEEAPEAPWPWESEQEFKNRAESCQSRRS